METDGEMDFFARMAGVEERGWSHVFGEIPVITKLYTTASVLITLAVNFEIISAYQIYLNTTLIIERFQFWRLITAFLYAGPFNFNTAFNLLFTYRYSRILEEHSFHRRTADYFLMLLLICTVILFLAAPLTDILFLGNALTHAILYLWCRRNPFQRVMIFGLLTLRADQVPFVLIGLCLLTGSPLSSDLIAMIAGHVYFYLEDVFPRQPLGFRIIKTPRFLKLIFNDLDEEEDSVEVRNDPQIVDENNNIIMDDGGIAAPLLNDHHVPAPPEQAIH